MVKLKIDSSYNELAGFTKHYIIYRKLLRKNDTEIALKILNMPVAKYRNILLKKFNARQDQFSKDCFFLFPEHARQAIDWIESMMVMNNLI